MPQRIDLNPPSRILRIAGEVIGDYAANGQSSKKVYIYDEGDNVRNKPRED